MHKGPEEARAEAEQTEEVEIGVVSAIDKERKKEEKKKEEKKGRKRVKKRRKVQQSDKEHVHVNDKLNHIHFLMILFAYRHK